MMATWHDMTRWQHDNMTRWQHDKSNMTWQDGNMIAWQPTMLWQHGNMTTQQHCYLLEWQQLLCQQCHVKVCLSTHDKYCKSQRQGGWEAPKSMVYPQSHNLRLEKKPIHRPCVSVIKMSFSGHQCWLFMAIAACMFFYSKGDSA